MNNLIHVQINIETECKKKFNELGEDGKQRI